MNIQRYLPQILTGASQAGTIAVACFSITGTVKAWRDFIELRTAPGAHPDIRIVAEQVKNVVNMLYGEKN